MSRSRDPKPRTVRRMVARAVAWSLLLAWGGVAPAADPTLHVVLVFDLDAAEIENHLELDLSALRTEFQSHVRADRLHLIEQSGGLSRRKILDLFGPATLAGQPVDGNDAVVFVFDGHGQYDPDKQDLVFLLRSSGEQLLRDEVVRAIGGCNARLAVVLNGSCTNIVRNTRLHVERDVAQTQSLPAYSTRPAFSALFEKLFVAPRGRVLISAAQPGEFAASYPGVASADGNALEFRGTLFVQSLAHELGDFNPSIKRVSVAESGRVPRVTLARAQAPPSWSELVDRLKRGVAADYARFLVPIDAFPGQPTQTVTAVLDLDAGGGSESTIARWGVTVGVATNGLRITAVSPGGWAAAANLQVDDVVVGFNAIALDEPDDLRAAIAGVRDDDLFRVVGTKAGGMPFTFVRRLSDGVAPAPEPRHLGVKVVAAPQGVRITLVEPNSLAERLGFEAGDILLSFNGRPTRQPADLRAAIVALGSDARVSFRLIDVSSGQVVSRTVSAAN